MNLRPGLGRQGEFDEVASVAVFAVAKEGRRSDVNSYVGVGDVPCRVQLFFFRFAYSSSKRIRTLCNKCLSLLYIPNIVGLIAPLP